MSETRGIGATVSRVLSFGASTRVELEGDVHEGVPRHVEVELSREQSASLALATGQRVRVLPAQLRVFPHPHKTDNNKATATRSTAS
ncbi:MAG: TOBE-like domain-containing protein [Moraxellaceae bacterium]|nr:TOBE-like domain-containing protein [Moraxellaceae bacterium]